MSRQRISRLQRQRVAAAAGYRCAYCHVSERIIDPFLEIVRIRRT